MYKIAFHDHVSAENREGILDEVRSMGGSIEREGDEIFISVRMSSNEEFIYAFLLQEDHRGTVTVMTEPNPCREP